jgi:excisionase family DNA binding protein
MSIDRSERLSAIRAVSRRDRADRDLAREIGARNVEPTAVARCPHGRGPARACSQCVGVRVERLPFAASGGRSMPERFLASCRRGARRAPLAPSTDKATRVSEARRSAAAARWSRVPVPPDQFTPRDVARLAGLHVKTVREHIQRGSLIALREGGRVLVTHGSLEQWLASRGQALPAIDSVADDHRWHHDTRPERVASATPISVDIGAHGAAGDPPTGSGSSPHETPAAVDTSPSEAQ